MCMPPCHDPKATGGLQPLLPQDDELIGALVNRLSPEQNRMRFHRAVKPTPTLLNYLAWVDYQQHLALVLTAQIDGVETVIGDVRFFVDAEDGEAAEFSLMVDPRFQRRGLGRWAMQALQAAAARLGLSCLHGCVDTGNTGMLALMQRCGCLLTRDREDRNMMNGDHRQQSLHSRRSLCIRELRRPGPVFVLRKARYEFHECW